MSEHNPTKTLLEQEAELAKAKAKAITDLLDERVALSKTTAARLDAIAGELKALGWHRTRTAIEAKSTQAGAGAGELGKK